MDIFIIILVGILLVGTREYYRAKFEDKIHKFGLKNIKSGDVCHCGNCDNTGHAYGILTGSGGSAPYCAKCGMNNKLTKIRE